MLCDQGLIDMSRAFIVNQYYFEKMSKIQIYTGVMDCGVVVFKSNFRRLKEEIIKVDCENELFSISGSKLKVLLLLKNGLIN